MTDGADPTVAIRRAVETDADGVAQVQLDAWRATYDFPLAHPDDAVRRWTRETLLPGTEAWVAVEPDGRIVAMMALSENMLEQLYVVPRWIGRGLGSRLLAIAKERRPNGLDLYTFQANTRARRFYEARRFVVVAMGDGAGNDEGQPDIRYAWRPGTAADLVVPSRDGTPLAVFRTGSADGPPLILVHGTTADHTTFRTIGPRLVEPFDVYSMDRRGRGASGDTLPYAIEREFEDLAAVANALAERSGRGVDVVGHSYGGRTALGAALLTTAIARVVCYEGAPSPPGASYHPPGIEDRLRERLAADDRDGALGTFLTEVVGMSATDLAAYRANPVWPTRAAAAGTILRELEAEEDPAASLDALGNVRQPVLQLLGSASIDVFAQATRALDARLIDGRVTVVEGARHAAHHTHPDAVVDSVRTFLT